MHCISLWQPWASALFAPANTGAFHAIKLHETRHWPMPKHLVNQWVAIHAAKRDTRDEREFWEDTVLEVEDFRRAFHQLGIESYDQLPRGCVIGKVMFGPSRQTTGQFNEPDAFSRDWGNYSEGRYAWPVIQFQRFATPIPTVGRQGFFTIPDPT